MLALARRMGRFLGEREYHARHARRAFAALERLGHPGRELTSKCDEYAGDVFGWRGYAPWLYVNCAVQGEFREGWIPDNYYGRIVIRRINGPYGILSNRKSLSARILELGPGRPETCLPDVGSFINGFFFDKHGRLLQGPTAMKESLFADSDRVVFKLDDSEQGRDVMVIRQQDFAPGVLPRGRDGVFQEFVTQHPDYRPLSPTAVATLRITTARGLDGQITARAAALRLGRGGDSHVKDSTSLYVPVDLARGTVKARGFAGDWSLIEAHPDTGVRFEGYALPSFPDCLDLALVLHQRVACVGCVGWDLAVDEEGSVKLLEWNAGHNGIKMSEALSGPCFTGLGWETLWKDAS